jgi:hypothetical protein
MANLHRFHSSSRLLDNRKRNRATDFSQHAWRAGRYVSASIARNRNPHGANAGEHNSTEEQA